MQKESSYERWKRENPVKESVIPFSTAEFSDKRLSPAHTEFKRLLMMIKDPDERNQIEREANHWSLSNNKPAYRYVEKFLSDSVLSENIQETLVIELNNKTLDESFLRSFGWLVQKALERMFGSNGSPIQLRGTKSQIRTFSNAISSEKRYMDALSQHGLDSPHTFRNKSSLEQAINKFERATGIKWPFTSK